MSDDNIDVKERYDKFVFNLSQFVSKPIKDFPSIKSEILDILKTHRPVRVVDYQYGLSNSLKQKTQLIVHECSERAKVREYFKIGKDVWKCCECHRTNSSSNNDTTELILAHGIVFIKIGHDCMPRQLSFVQQIQKLYKEKNIDAAVALQKSVLGSEDLNISVKKTGAAAGKRGTKVAKAVVPESTLQFIRENIQEFEQSNMDESVEEIQERLSPEASFANIIENLKDYTQQKAEVILSNKSKLLSCLKTHRPVKIGNYEFGLSENLHPNRRLNVFEWNDRKRIREYSQKPNRVNLWVCRECFRVYQRASIRGVENPCPDLYFISGIVFIPNEHSCKALNYFLVMHYQKLLHEGDVQGAQRMKQKINFIYGECNFANIVNVLAETVSASLPENKSLMGNRKEVDDNGNEKNSKNLKRKIDSNNGNDSSSPNEKPSVQKKSRLNKSALNNTVTYENDAVLLVEEFPIHKKSNLKKKASDIPTDDINKCYNDNFYSVTDKPHQKLKRKEKNDIAENMYPSIQQDSETIDVKMEEVELSTVATIVPIFSFKTPSALMFKEICAKLKIEYRNRAEKLWKQIMFSKIDTVTTPEKILIHHFKTKNFYEILSKFFTGKINEHEQIRATINEEFPNKMVSSGELSVKEFNKKYLDTVTDQHLSFIAKFLPCRILIYNFNGAEIRKYGKWKSTSNERVTLVIALINGFYSIVLDF